VDFSTAWVEQTGGKAPVRCVISLSEEKKSETKENRDPAGTWTDPKTKLMWQTDPPNEMGVQNCKDVRLAGFSNWRLPTIKELKGIMRKTPTENGCMWAKEITGDCGEFFDSATSSSGESFGHTLVVDFGEGVVIEDFGPLSICVRNTK